MSNFKAVYFKSFVICVKKTIQFLLKYDNVYSGFTKPDLPTLVLIVTRQKNMFSYYEEKFFAVYKISDVELVLICQIVFPDLVTKNES